MTLPTHGEPFRFRPFLLSLPLLFVLPATGQAHFEPLLGIDPEEDLARELHATVGSRRLLSAEFLPSGEILGLTQSGEVYVIPAAGGGGRLLFTVPDVDSTRELGALDLTLDPRFDENRRLYVYYSSPAAGGGTRVRVGRYTLDTADGAATARSGTVLWESPGPTTVNTAHVGGSINVGPDDHLYLTVGDNVVAGNATDLSTIFGKTLRLELDGSVPDDNPFVNRDGALGEIWAYGLRNPFRAGFDPLTGDFIVGDVGGNEAVTAREELNVVRAGENYGWPACEGADDCPPGITLPVFEYGHDLNERCCRNRAIVAGQMYRADAIPFADDVYVYADFADSTFGWVRFGEDYAVLGEGTLSPVGERPVALPAWIGVNPYDGLIYYIEYDREANGRLHRIRYTGEAAGGQPPIIASVSAEPRSVLVGDAVQFGADVADADGDVLEYDWDFGDGERSDDPAPLHAYRENGEYTVRLAVTAGGDTARAEPIEIAVGDVPVATIESPADGDEFVAGETLVFSGSAVSATGEPIDAASLTWDVRLFHGNHDHPELSDAIGDTLRFPVPTTGHGFEEDTGYVVELVATDADGLTATDTIRLTPQRAAVTIDVEPADLDLSIAIDDLPRPLPHRFDAAVGFEHRLAAPETACRNGNRWLFDGWSDGAARERTFPVPPEAIALGVRYVDGGVPCEAGGEARADDDVAGESGGSGSGAAGGTLLGALLLARLLRRRRMPGIDDGSA